MDSLLGWIGTFTVAAVVALTSALLLAFFGRVRTPDTRPASQPAS
ncbi:hypothetical protein [Actinoalloteichus spitiensis]|nr:hypothetical protein [Actinoalloteichus spitiensis]